MRLVSILLLAILSAGCSAVAEPDGATLLAGAAMVDVTPPVGWRRAGGYHEVLSTGVHDPLYVKALVLEQNGRRIAIVVGDFCGVSREISAPARKLIQEHMGIPAERVVFSATHNHGGPEFTGVLWDVWHARASDAQGRDRHASEDYSARVIRAAATAVEEGVRSLRPVSLEVASPRLPGLAFNRRFHMKDGTVRFNPGRRNPDILRAAGPVDDEFQLLLFRDVRDRSAVASFSAFPLHTAVFGGPEFGADFPGILQRELASHYGPGMVSIFAEGAAGDINHIDVSAPEPRGSESERISVAMATAFRGAAWVGASSTLDAARAIVPVPIADASAADESSARDLIGMKRDPNPPFMHLVDAYRTLWIRRIRERDGGRAQEEVQAFRLSEDVAIVTLPHEIFVELGMAIKAQSPFRTTVIVSLANDIDFYVPTRKAFGEGSYEVSTSPYLPGGGELLVDAALRLLRDLKR